MGNTGNKATTRSMDGAVSQEKDSRKPLVSVSGILTSLATIGLAWLAANAVGLNATVKGIETTTKSLDESSKALTIRVNDIQDRVGRIEGSLNPVKITASRGRR